MNNRQLKIHIRGCELVDSLSRMRGESGASEPILCAHLLRRVDEKLIDLLSSLTSSEWDVQTIVPRWKVRDVAAHLLDTARELTERWHHQQQIRLATNRPGIMTPDLYHPVLECFVRGLPHAYRNVDAPDGTSLLLEISGECGGRWLLSRRAAQWRFVKPPEGEFASRVVIPQELAWRVFTKGIDRDSARKQIKVEGNTDLAEKVFQLTAIVG